MILMLLSRLSFVSPQASPVSCGHDTGEAKIISYIQQSTQVVFKTMAQYENIIYSHDDDLHTNYIS